MMTIKQEPDRVRKRPLALATLIVAVVSAVYILVAWGLDAGAPDPSPTPWARIPDEVNQVEVARFDQPTAAEIRAAAARERLESYGWVDREAGIVHIPVDRAAEIVVSRERREGAR